MNFSFVNNRDKLYSYFFILLILATTLLGYYGSVDKVSVQWLYLSLSLLFAFVFFTFKNLDLFDSFLKIHFTKFILAIIFLGAFSMIFANNQQESIIAITKWLIYFLRKAMA